MTDIVNVGTAANAGNGDPLRTAFAQINRRFTELALYPRGDWAPATAYTATPRREWVISDGTAYVAVVNHTSGSSFATDLAAGKWLAVDVAQLIADLAGTGGAALVGYDGDTVQDVLDSAKPMADYTALRAYTGRATGVRITTPGIAGVFQRTGNAVDNGGTVIVDGAGRSWQRLFDGAVNVKWFGAKADYSAATNTGTDNSAAFTAAAAVGNPYAPTGQYLIAQTVQTPQNVGCDFFGDGVDKTIIIFQNSTANAIAINIRAPRSKVHGLTVKKDVRNHAVVQKGVSFSNNNAGVFSYLNSVSLRDVDIENFHTSLEVEAVYFMNIENVKTRRDRFGFTLNKQVKNGGYDLKPCTTILATHLYCNGSGNEYTLDASSVGWELYDTIDLVMVNCVSEWYYQTYYAFSLYTLTLIAPYFEHCEAGAFQNAITGSVQITNPSFINASKTKAVLIETLSNLTINGGRVLAGSTQELVRKQGSCQVYLRNAPGTVSSTNGWDQQGVTIESSTGFERRASSHTELVISTNYFGRQISIGSTFIKFTPINVSQLPTASTAGVGAESFVQDANATTFGTVVAAGGTNKVPVYSDGTYWRIG